MGACGWVNNDYIDSSSVHYKNDYLPPLGTVQGINADGLNLRARPSTKGEILARYPVGTRMEILGVINSWAHVCLQDGKTDYMMLKYLGSEPEKAAKNSFTLLKDIENLRQGDRVRISVPPHAINMRTASVIGRNRLPCRAATPKPAHGSPLIPRISGNFSLTHSFFAAMMENVLGHGSTLPKRGFLCPLR